MPDMVPYKLSPEGLTKLARVVFHQQQQQLREDEEDATPCEADADGASGPCSCAQCVTQPAVLEVRPRSLGIWLMTSSFIAGNRQH